MTREEVVRLVAGVAYKPGSEFSIGQGSVPPVLLITLPVVDAYNEGRGFMIRRGAAFPAEYRMWGREKVLQFIRQLVLELEEHEVDEWLKCDGKRRTNAHPEKAMIRKYHEELAQSVRL